MNITRPFVFLSMIICAVLLPGCSGNRSSEKPAPGTHVVFKADDVDFALVYVPGKSFFTGTDDSSSSRIENGFLISETEVTYELWKKVWNWAVERGYEFANPGLKGNEGNGTGLHPATTLNWRDSLVWSNALTEWFNAATGSRYTCVYINDGKPVRDARGNNAGVTDAAFPDPKASGFRIPSSGEWELAARFRADLNDDGDIRDDGEFYPGSFASGAEASWTDPVATSRVAVYGVSSTAPVGSRLPNALGIYDMSGNVEEWCFGSYNDPGWSSRVSRGGCFLAGARYMQTASEVRHDPYTENSFIGLRIAKNE